MNRTCVLAVIACVAVLAPTASTHANPAREVAQKVNDYRSAHGLKKLRVSRSLSLSAHAYSRHLLAVDRFGHAGHIRATRRFRLLGENLAFRWGWRSSANLPVRSWMRSSRHRSLMLSNRFRYIGIGRAIGRFGSRRATVWVMHTGR